MKTKRISQLIILFTLLFGWAGLSPVMAELTAEHRTQLAEVKKQLGKVNGHTRKGELEEAKKLLTETNTQLQQIITAAEVEENDRAVRTHLALVERMIQQIEEAEFKAKIRNGISFKKDIAPILEDNCSSCHGGNPRGGLRLNSFAGMVAGGDNGPLLVPGNPNRSMLMARVSTPNPQFRMPRNDEALNPQQIQLLGAWIAQGARYDGTAEQPQDMMLADLINSTMRSEEMKANPIVVAKPDGDETVSFTKDIAPFFVQLCYGCHSGANPDSGFSMMTFEDILKGGDSGELLIPENLEDSRLWRLVGGLENPRMPRGQGRITRKNYADLKTWIEEGIKFDGNDPKQNLRDMVPSEQEMQQQRLAAMSDAQWMAYRKEQSDGQWKRTLPRDTPKIVERAQLLIYGTAEQSTLEGYAQIAESVITNLEGQFGTTKTPLWKGKLAVFVLPDEFGMDEYFLTLGGGGERQDYRFADVEVTANHSVARVAFWPAGVGAGSNHPTAEALITQVITSAWLQAKRPGFPEVLASGYGMLMGQQASDLLKASVGRGKLTLQELNRNANIFENGSYSRQLRADAGAALIVTMLSQTNIGQVNAFIKQIAGGAAVINALQQTFGIQPNALKAAAIQ